MRNTRAHRLAAGAAIAVAAAVAAGCGGSSGSKATPLAPTTASSPAPGNTTSARQGATSTPGSAELAALQQQLNAAGSALDASGSAVSGSDVNAAKAQEGSAPS